MSLFIVFVGTMAQTEMNEFKVSREIFYANWFWVHLRYFFPKSFFPNLGEVPGAFPFVGGWTIAIALSVNLIAAHLIRFKIQARGNRMWIGMGVAALSLLLLGLVVVNGHNAEGLQGKPPFSLKYLWYAAIVGLGIGWSGLAVGTLALEAKRLRYVCAVGTVGLGALLGWILFTRFMLSEPALRILWQLLQGVLVGVVLLGASILLFKKRAGIVVIHSGVALMMLSQFMFGRALEENISLEEGQTTNWANEITKVELAVIDPSDAEVDDVVVVPGQMLKKSQGFIKHEDLPFDVEVVEFHDNSEVVHIQKSESKDIGPVTAGYGKSWIMETRSAGTGTSVSRRIDMPSAYIQLHTKDGEDSLGTFLVSTHAGRPQPVRVGDKVYHVFLRFQRNYKPYYLYLVDVRKDDYLGTSTARSYESDVHLVSDEHDKRDDHKIWMNNPLRFAGQTMYQSNWNQHADGTEATGLQVVTNTGWMIPYIACMIVAIGMLYHFSGTLTRFLKRRERQVATAMFSPGSVSVPLKTSAKSSPPVEPEVGYKRLACWIMPAALITLTIFALVRGAMPTKTKYGEMNLYQAGRIPITYGGRVKPLDTLARNTLKVISNRDYFYAVTLDNEGHVVDKVRKPAIEWMLDTMAGLDRAREHRVFRVVNFDVLNLLNLKGRKGYRYSVDELLKNMTGFEEQLRKVRAKPVEKMSLYDRKVVELNRRITGFMRIYRSIKPPVDLPDASEVQADPQSIAFMLQRLRAPTEQLNEEMMRMEPPPPRIVPVFGFKRTPESNDSDSWDVYSRSAIEAFRYDLIKRLPPAVQSQLPDELKRKPTSYDGTVAIRKIVSSYAKREVKDFNRAVTEFHAKLSDKAPAQFRASKTDMEASFNKSSIFKLCQWMYFIAFCLSAVAWIKWGKVLNFTAFSFIAFLFTVHTIGLIMRMSISGRPPVTNLYSSAVFIGWGAVMFGLILEWIYKIGIGNIVASVAGFASLFIAGWLSIDGDTMSVLVAVLDTQFWLATHVTCITLGYSTTFLAGGLGIAYIMRGWFSNSMSPELGKEISRMTYGVTCFSIFFSFVGTVLGGLWADDSWGRFWGWDPKENGALMIVIWNALVLHARWGGMIKDRGLAVLVVGGNIITGWSWFGVNELGVGLHSYGFTEGRLMYLGLFSLSQLVVITLGCLPTDTWIGNRRRTSKS